MNQTTAAKILEEIKASAKTCTDEPRFVRVFKPGYGIRQGDLYLLAVPALDYREKDAELWESTFNALTGDNRGDIIKELKTTKRGKKTQNRQMARGTTKGSRHILVGTATIYEGPESESSLLGPVFKTKGRTVLEHPQHGNISLPSCTARVVFQRDWAAAERLRRQD